MILHFDARQDAAVWNHRYEGLQSITHTVMPRRLVAYMILHYTTMRLRGIRYVWTREDAWNRIVIIVVRFLYQC